jgi:hypothetical protein
VWDAEAYKVRQGRPLTSREERQTEQRGRPCRTRVAQPDARDGLRVCEVGHAGNATAMIVNNLKVGRRGQEVLS